MPVFWAALWKTICLHLNFVFSQKLLKSTYFENQITLEVKQWWIFCNLCVNTKVRNFLRTQNTEKTENLHLPPMEGQYKEHCSSPFTDDTKCWGSFPALYQLKICLVRLSNKLVYHGPLSANREFSSPVVT